MPLLQVFQSALANQIDRHVYGSRPAELYEPIHYLMSLQGKRLRPLLTVLSAYLFTDEWEQALAPAHAVEVFHNFTLMHDDIMDNAPLRRNNPTVHEKWNANTAILSGDVMLVQAYELFLSLPPELLPRALSRFNRTASEVCEGQQLDMNFESSQNVGISDYLEMIRLKTSVLLGYAMELGGMIGKADDKTIEELYQAGVNMGLGFQLTDDLLDVYGDPDKFGKQVGGDILSNKKTFLFLKALELAPGETRNKLTSLFSTADGDGAEKIRQVVAIYDSLNIRELTETLIKSYFDNATKSIGELSVVSPERKQPLLEFAQALMKRQK